MVDLFLEVFPSLFHPPLLHVFLEAAHEGSDVFAPRAFSVEPLEEVAEGLFFEVVDFFGGGFSVLHFREVFEQQLACCGSLCVSGGGFLRFPG